jgi:AcrR family transcriptional regulator
LSDFCVKRRYDYTMQPARLSGETKADRTRKRILAAAARELVAHGYAGASLRSVAEGAGLKLGSLYFHFETKEDLMLEVLRDAFALACSRVQAAIDALGPDASAGARVAAAIGAHIQTVHSDIDPAIAVMRASTTLPEQLQTSFAALARRYARLWDELLRSAQATGAVNPALEIPLLRHLLISAMNGTQSLTCTRPIDTKHAADTLAALLLHHSSFAP